MNSIASEKMQWWVLKHCSLSITVPAAGNLRGAFSWIPQNIHINIHVNKYYRNALKHAYYIKIINEYFKTSSLSVYTIKMAFFKDILFLSLMC